MCDAETGQNSSRGLIDENTLERERITKIDMWPYGIPIDQEKNFWVLTLLFVGLMFTQISYTIS